MDAVARLGSNIKTETQNESCVVFTISDETGEGVMTVYQVLPGVMVCFSDMHMEKCRSEFELKAGQKVFCIDHCREGRIEMEVQPGVFSIMQEKELRLDNREHHKGMACYPLKHYHGVSIFLEVEQAQATFDEMFHGFSVKLEQLREKYCCFEKPYVIRDEESLSRLIASFYPRNMERPELAKTREYYLLKVVELLLYLNVLPVAYVKENKPYYYRTQMEKIRAIHAQITTDLKSRVTIEELSRQYDMPLTTMKKCFREIYGDSIYSYQKRYRINVAASMLLQNETLEIQELALRMGYENPGKFSAAFRNVMGISPTEYRIRKEGIV